MTSHVRLVLAAGMGFCLAALVASDSRGFEERQRAFQTLAVPDVQPQAEPVPAEKAAKDALVPDGFRVNLFAAEPDVQQPIAFTTDARGRLWVVECLTYPNWVKEKTANDRIVILEDSNHDGKFDKRTVFYDKGANFSGLELGFGGVWVCATPDFLFIPDRDGDDKPDGEPVVKLDGWDIGAKHNVFNALRWGPDGWLYGCNGILSNSKVGKPGASDDERVSLNCGVWRYHPTREVFEWVASGTTNPWGLDFNDVGEMFITNCVIPHIFHVTPGAHFQRMFGQDLNPHVYGLIESCADHIHWGGGAWTDSRGGKGKHSDAGGGHAHAGAMVYLADNWPKEYRGEVFMCNIHGHRVNHDSLARRGSGYVAQHSPDFFLSTDEWFRGLEMKYGPDGAVYLTDWSDTGECHEFDAHGAHHNSGRIFKISFGTPAPVDVDLSRSGNDELAKMHLHANDWYVRQARLQLQMQAAAGKDLTGAVKVLRGILKDHGEMPRRLRALWTLYAIGQLTEADLVQQLDHADETQRVWGVRLLCDQKPPSDAVVERFAKMSRDDRSQAVRLALASALQKIPLEKRWSTVEGLVSHADDAADANLPLMIWYAMEPLVGADRARAVSLSSKCQIPLLRQYIARRAVSK